MGEAEKKKYCAEFNKGNCNQSALHEGRLNGNIVMKYHICGKCLYEDNLDKQHAGKDCGKLLVSPQTQIWSNNHSIDFMLNTHFRVFNSGLPKYLGLKIICMIIMTNQ